MVRERINRANKDARKKKKRTVHEMWTDDQAQPLQAQPMPACTPTTTSTTSTTSTTATAKVLSQRDGITRIKFTHLEIINLLHFSNTRIWDSIH